MIYSTLFLSRLSRLAAAPPKSGNSFVLILVILIFCCLAVFFSLFIVDRKKTQRNALSQKKLSFSIRNESDHAMRRALTQFSLYFKRYSPGRVSQRLLQGESAPIEQDSNIQESGIQNRQWLSLVEECVDLFDELDRVLPDLDPVEQEMALHVTSRLQEILTRSGVEVITHDAFFDPMRHRLVPPGQMPGVKQAPITILSPGFAVGRMVLRHAHVRLTAPSSSSGE